MKETYKITIEELEELMIEALKREGQSEDFVTGYVEAQKKYGLLRKACPQWMRDSAELFYHLPPASGLT